jgi:hypothetical protein
MSGYSKAVTYPIAHRNARLRRRQERGSVGNAVRYCAGGTTSLLATSGRSKPLSKCSVGFAVQITRACATY